MRLRVRAKTMAVVAGMALVGFGGTANEAEGQDIRRMGKWQFNIPITFTSGSRFEGERDTYLDVNDDVGWGFGFGYHFDQNFFLGFETTWLSANYEAQIEFDDDDDQNPDGTTRVNGRLDAASFLMVGQYNVLDRSRFTPFVQGKLGWSYSDSNIPNAPPQGGCWWDPWWGYICNTWQPTYSSWDFTYGGSVGLRAQLAPSFFLEGSYNFMWVNYDFATPRQDGFRLNIGWIN
jgi:opacity protein-like surface antigen